MAIRVLFVCLGNICRSPAAHGVFQHLVTEAGLEAGFTIASAGTGAWHTGERADARMRAAAQRRGIELSSVARRVTAGDFEDFDHIFAMDATILQELQRRAPAAHRHKIRLFRDFDPDAPGTDVPDPYYGDDGGFDAVLEIVTRTGRAILDEIRPPDRPGTS